MKDFKDYLPIITVALLATGSIWIISYYSYFGIDIKNYIDFSEIFQLQFAFYLLLSTSIAAGIFYGLSFDGFFYSESTFSSRRKVISIIRPIINTRLYKFFDKNIPRRINKRLRRIRLENKPSSKPFYGKPVLLMLGSLMAGVVSALFMERISVNTYNKQITSDLLGLSTCVCCCLFFIIGLYYSIKVSKPKFLNNFMKKARLALLYIIFIGLGIVVNRSEAYNIKNNMPKYDVTILLKDKPIGSDTTILTTSKSLYYIGQTKGYLFLYNNDKKTAHIIPRSQILDIETTKIEYNDGVRIESTETKTEHKIAK